MGWNVRNPALLRQHCRGNGVAMCADRLQMCLVCIVMHGRSICGLRAKNAGVASGFTCKTRPHAVRQLVKEANVHAKLHISVTLLAHIPCTILRVPWIQQFQHFDKNSI